MRFLPPPATPGKVDLGGRECNEIWNPQLAMGGGGLVWILYLKKISSDHSVWEKGDKKALQNKDFLLSSSTSNWNWNELSETYNVGEMWMVN